MTYEQVNNISFNIALGIYASIVLCAVYYLLGFWGINDFGIFCFVVYWIMHLCDKRDGK